MASPPVEQTESQDLQKVAADAQEVLITAESVFPFVLFPDTIEVDRVKATITRRLFFRVAEVISVQIEDILNVESDVGPFFGSLNIFTRFFADKPLQINFLSRKDTQAVKEILQGYIIARSKDIDCSSIEKPKLISLLLQLGRDNAAGTS